MSTPPVRASATVPAFPRGPAPDPNLERRAFVLSTADGRWRPVTRVLPSAPLESAFEVSELADGSLALRCGTRAVERWQCAPDGFDAGVSPDGSMIVRVESYKGADGATMHRLWVRQLAGGAERELAGDLPGSCEGCGPSWSPSGRYLAHAILVRLANGSHDDRVRVIEVASGKWVEQVGRDARWSESDWLLFGGPDFRLYHAPSGRERSLGRSCRPACFVPGGLVVHLPAERHSVVVQRVSDGTVLAEWRLTDEPVRQPQAGCPLIDGPLPSVALYEGAPVLAIESSVSCCRGVLVIHPAPRAPRCVEESGVPQLSPNGAFVGVAASAGPNETRPVVVDLRSGARFELARTGGYPFGPVLWTRDSAHVLVRSTLPR